MSETPEPVPGDRHGYYEVLRLEPGASAEQVERAYRVLEEEWRVDNSLPRFQIQEAYRFLSDPEEKARYDAAQDYAPAAPMPKRALLLTTVMIFLLLFAGFIFPGFLRGGPPPFNAGDALVCSIEQQVLGRVIRLDSQHHFPNAVIGEAYLIEAPDGGRRWYPAGDVERYCRRAQPEPLEGSDISATRR